MKTKQMIIQELFNSEDYNLLFNRIVKHENMSDELYEDFKSELLLILLEKDEEYIQSLYYSDKLKYVYIRIIKNQLFSKTSEFYRKYKKLNKEYTINKELDEEYLEDDIDIDELKDFDILTYIKNNNILNWYETTLLIDYYNLDRSKPKKKTFRELEEKYDIYYSSIHYTIKKSIKRIKKQLKKDELI